MILDPIQAVECDRCGRRDEFDMTPLAQRSWDNRNLDAKLKRAGWIVDGDNHYCSQACAEGAAEAARAAQF